MLANTSSPSRHVFYLLNSALVIGVLLGVAVAVSSPAIVALTLLILLAIIVVFKTPTISILGFIALTSTVLGSDVNPGISLGFGHIYLTDILLATQFLLIGGSLLFNLEKKFVRTPLNTPLFLFVAITLLSTVIALIQSKVSLIISLGPIRDIMNYFIFFSVISLIRTEKQINILIRGIIAFSVIVSIVMIAQYSMGATLPFLPGRVEVLSTEGTGFSSVTRIIPPGYSIVFIGFVTTISIWIFNPTRQRSLILTIPLVLNGIGILLTFKRHFWVALVLIFMIMALISNRKEIQKFVIRGISTLAIMLVGIFFIMNYTGTTGPDLIKGSFDRLISLTELQTYQDPNSSLRWRDFEIQYAIPQIASHPLIGIGLGTMYRPFVPGKDWSEFDGRAFVHNGIYSVLLKSGWLGFLSLTWVMVLFVARGFKYWRLIPNQFHGAFMLGFTLSILGMIVGLWVEPLITEWSWTGIIAVMMGINETLIRTVPVFAENTGNSI